MAGLVLAFVEFFLFEQSRSASESTVIFLLLKLVELLAILYIALNLRMLQKGGEKLARATSPPPSTRSTSSATSSATGRSSTMYSPAWSRRCRSR